MTDVDGVDITELSPMAWRLLRVAAGFEQRAIERELNELMQAHVSMLESGTRALSLSRRNDLFDLYSAELTPEQIRAITENF
ncbi:hypothetical protein [Haladaptatus halobius]|jgi:hypothetical protein|uniref:hypothetical protein n=1 Tax=Haladaptatus halobius TaxID=2884875 RepID=UPI001D09C115|nr:hypothetical protein [Haladaptatus halobius]